MNGISVIPEYLRGSCDLMEFLGFQSLKKNQISGMGFLGFQKAKKLDLWDFWSGMEFPGMNGVSENLWNFWGYKGWGKKKGFMEFNRNDCDFWDFRGEKKWEFWEWMSGIPGWILGWVIPGGLFPFFPPFSSQFSPFPPSIWVFSPWNSIPTSGNSGIAGAAERPRGRPGNGAGIPTGEGEHSQKSPKSGNSGWEGLPIPSLIPNPSWDIPGILWEFHFPKFLLSWSLSSLWKSFRGFPGCWDWEFLLQD